MAYRVLADVVVVVHFAFVVFIAVGGFLAWRWRRVAWLHLFSAAWGVAIIAIGFTCPLTPLEKGLRERGGEDAYDGGFIDRYIEGVVYPEAYTPHLRALAAVLVVVAYGRLLLARRDPGSGRDEAATAPTSSVGRRGPPDLHRR